MPSFQSINSIPLHYMLNWCSIPSIYPLEKHSFNRSIHSSSKRKFLFRLSGESMSRSINYQLKHPIQLSTPDTHSIIQSTIHSCRLSIPSRRLIRAPFHLSTRRTPHSIIHSKTTHLIAQLTIRSCQKSIPFRCLMRPPVHLSTWTLHSNIQNSCSVKFPFR